MSEDDYRRAVLHRSQIVFQPFQLLVTKVTETSRFQVHYIHKPDEVDAVLVEAVPARALGVSGITLPEHRPVVVQHVVLTGDEEHFFACALEYLVDGIELFRRGEVGDVSGMKNELGGFGEGVNLVHSSFQRRYYIWIRRLIEAHVAVADLYE